MSTPSAEVLPSRPGPLGLHPAILLLAFIHFVIDGYGNIYAPLLPLLKPRLGLSFFIAGTLAMAFQMATSVAQLGFGQLADRWRPRLLLVAGPVLTVVVLSLTGLAPTPLTLAAVLLIGGLGSAAYHPPAAALAHRLGGYRPGFAMSVYITGGTLGFSLGPLFFAPFAERFGLEWTPLLMLPGLLAVALCVRKVPVVPLHADAQGRGFRALRPYAKPLTLLYLIVVLRQLTALSFATFVPLLLTDRGISVSVAGGIVALYLFASGIGGFVGGPIADRIGPKRVIVLSLLMSVPFLVAAPQFEGWAFVALLAVGGFFLQSTLPVNVTYGQTIAPVSAATVSSLMMGFAWGTGGLSVPAVGWLADHIGIATTLSLMAFSPILAATCALPLPRRPSFVAPGRVS